jgi:hypothetical protein
MPDRTRWTFAALVAVLFVTLSFTIGLTSPVAAGPDDDPQTGPWVEDGTVIRDRVRLSSDDPSADPVDWFRVNLTAGPTQLDLLRIDVNLTRNGGAQFLVWAAIYDPDGALLTEVKATNFAVKSTATLCHRTGVYLIQVYTYSYFDCHYRIAFNITQRANVTDGDDTLDEATYLEPPADVTGHLHGIMDPFDHYAVNLTRDDQYYEFIQVRLSPNGTSIGQRDLDLFLIVRNGQGRLDQVAASTSNGSNEMAFYAATLEDQTIYIRCHAYGGNTGYALNVTVYKVSDDGNNNILRAEELDAGSSRDDSLNLTDRLDYFKVNLSGGDILTAQVQAHDWDPGTRKPDLNIYMYSPNGLIINWSHSYDPLERATVTAPDGDPAAWYYILVTFFDRNPASGVPAWGNYTINITVDRAPRIVAQLPLVVEEDGLLDLALDSLVQDPEGHLVSVMTIPGGNVHAIVTGSRAIITPSANFSGPANFTLFARDQLREVLIIVPVNVTPVPDAPGLADLVEPILVDEDGQVTVDLGDVIVDGDGDPVELTPLWNDSHPLGGSILVGTTLTVIPDPDIFGNLTLPIEARDDTGLVASIQLPVHVLPLPDPPVVLTPEATINATEDDRGIEFDLATMFQDPDGDLLDYMISEASHVGVIVIGSILVIDVEPDYHGTARVIIEAIGEGRVTAELRINVTSVPDPPLVTSSEPADDVDLTEGDGESFTVTAEDPEGGTLSYAWFLDGVLVPGEDLPRFELVTNHSSQGNLLVTARVSNAAEESYVNWSVHVTDVNRPPTLVLKRPKEGDTFTEGTNVAFEAVPEDPDGDTLSVQWIEKGEVIGTGSSFTTSGLKAGKHTITARVVDPHGISAEANVTFTIEEEGGLPGLSGPLVLTTLLVGVALAAVWHRSRKD